ncbi:hypothetical protein ENSA5_33400 [Enhygromyxa salina]|uniref:Uncharacterized protein n=1 Tax=Enhygromyxa salina TaxID=215803 RepID=A0A2S9XXG8_9BACT|nr:hypothetical protein ENSA5_33400 [Enhygromyxa salina]
MLTAADQRAADGARDDLQRRIRQPNRPQIPNRRDRDQPLTPLSNDQDPRALDLGHDRRLKAMALIAPFPDQQALVGVEPAQQPRALERIELVDEGTRPRPGPVGIIDRPTRARSFGHATPTEGPADARDPDNPPSLLPSTPGHAQHPAVELEAITDHPRAVAQPPIHAEQVEHVVRGRAQQHQIETRGRQAQARRSRATVAELDLAVESQLFEQLPLARVMKAAGGRAAAAPGFAHSAFSSRSASEVEAATSHGPR